MLNLKLGLKNTLQDRKRYDQELKKSSHYCDFKTWCCSSPRGPASTRICVNQGRMGSSCSVSKGGYSETMQREDSFQKVQEKEEGATLTYSNPQIYCSVIG